MAITHVTALRNTLANSAVDVLNGGNLVIMTSGDVEVATNALSATAAPAAVNGVKTFNAISDDASATGGTAALFKMETSGNAEQWRGTVTATGGGGDLELTTTVIAAGVTVSISSFTYTASL